MDFYKRRIVFCAGIVVLIAVAATVFWRISSLSNNTEDEMELLHKLGINESEVIFNASLRYDENKENNIVFICDIIGGTPFNTAAKISLEKEGIGVVGGCNVNAIIEMIMAKDLYELEELLDELVDRTKKSVCKYKNIEIAIQDISEEDGI